MPSRYRVRATFVQQIALPRASKRCLQSDILHVYWRFLTFGLCVCKCQFSPVQLRWWIEAETKCEWTNTQTHKRIDTGTRGAPVAWLLAAATKRVPVVGRGHNCYGNLQITSSSSSSTKHVQRWAKMSCYAQWSRPQGSSRLAITRSQTFNLSLCLLLRSNLEKFQSLCIEGWPKWESTALT